MQFNPRIVTDSNNNPYVVWQGPGPGDTTHGQIKFSKSIDGGSTWTSWSDLSNFAGYYQRYPDITFDSNDDIHVVWNGSDASNPSGSLVRYISSGDGGVAWSDLININEDITAGDGNYNGSPRIVSDANDTLHMISTGRIAPSVYSNVRHSVAQVAGQVLTLSNSTVSTDTTIKRLTATLDTPTQIQQGGQDPFGSVDIEIRYERNKYSVSENGGNLIIDHGAQDLQPFSIGDSVLITGATNVITTISNISRDSGATYTSTITTMDALPTSPTDLELYGNIQLQADLKAELDSVSLQELSENYSLLDSTTAQVSATLSGVSGVNADVRIISNNTDLNDLNITKIQLDFDVIDSTTGEYASQLYTFDIGEFTTDPVLNINLELLTAATAEVGDGVTAKIWNDTAGDWEILFTNTDGTIGTTAQTHDISTNIDDYIDTDDIVRFLLHTTHPSTANQLAILKTDFLKLTTTESSVRDKQIKIDTSTPEIDAITAGPDNTNRTSLNSGDWLSIARTGGDNQLSFTWSDPDSPADDTFYYEINSLATADQIDGTEDSTTDLYIDDITVLEATTYLHLRPKNGSGTWGTEKVFEIKYDLITPDGGSVSYVDGYQTLASVDIVVDPGSDAESGMSTDPADYLLEYKMAPLANDICGTYGEWEDSLVDEVPGGTSYSFSAINGKCYQFRYTVHDAVGLETSYVSSVGGIVKVSTENPTISCSVEEGTNPEYQYQVGTTEFYTALQTGDFTVTATVTDDVSGVQSVSFPVLGTGFTGGGDVTSAPYDTTYSWTTGATTSPAGQLVTVTSNSGLTNTCDFTVTEDSVAPVTGELNYITQYITSLATDPAMNANDGSDDGSGIDTTTRKLQRSEATLSDGQCGTYGSYADTTYTGTYPSISDTGTIEQGTCYMYQWIIRDYVQNEAIYTPSTEYKVDTTTPNTAVSGVTESAPTIFYNTGTKEVYYQTTIADKDFTVEADATDPESAIAKVNFPDVGLGFTGGTDDTEGPYSEIYIIAADTNTSPATNTVTGHNNAGLTITDTFDVIVDNDAPINSSVTCPADYDSDGNYTINGSYGTDSLSGVDTANVYIQRQDGTLTNDTCTDYGQYLNIGSAGDTNIGEAALTVGCYQYQYYTVDYVGNETVSASCTVRIDLTVPNTPLLDITESSDYIHYDETTLYYNNTVGTPGSFDLNVTATDTQTDIALVILSSQFGDEPTDDTADGDVFTFPYSIEQSSTCTTPITVTVTNTADLNVIAEMPCILDTTSPTITVPASAEGAVSTDRTLDFSWDQVIDTDADVFSIEICIDSDKADVCDHTFSTLAGTDTTYQWADEAEFGTIYFAKIRATDNVGNVSEWSAWSEGVTPDGFSPTITADNADTSTWFTDMPTITVTAADAESGLNKVTYSWDSPADTNSTETSHNGTIAIPSEGQHTLYLWAVDNANNQETWSGDYWLDTIEPTIDSATLSPDNTYVEITFNEAVYNTLGYGALDITDFTLNFVQNGGTSTAVTMVALKQLDGSDLVGGESVIRVYINVIGLPAELETVELVPTDSTSIYDIGGNTMFDTQTTGTFTLNDTSYLAFSSTPTDPESIIFSDFKTNSFSEGNYTSVATDDEDYVTVIANTDGQYSAAFFIYNTNAVIGTVNRLSFHNISAATAEAGDGVTVKIWNHFAHAWEVIDTNADGAMGTTEIVYDSVADVDSYTDENGIVRILVHSTHPATATQDAELNIDWMYRRLWNEINIGLKYFDGTETIVVGIEPTEMGLSSPLRIHEHGTNYGISLVNPDDPYASGMMAQTVNSGVKTWLKLKTASDPDVFNFTNVTDIDVSTLVISDEIFVYGFEGTTSVSVSGDGSPKISINGGDWGTSDTIFAGNSIRVRLTTSADYDTISSARVMIGGVSDIWNVTTKLQDITPDVFTFNDSTGVEFSTLTTSNLLNISGIEGDVEVSVSGEGSPEISIAGGGWVSSGTITDGQSLEVRLTSSPVFETVLAATVTVGTEIDEWGVMTRAKFPAEIQISPGNQTGMDVVGGTSPGTAVTFTASNTGELPTTALSTLITGGNTGNFEIINDTCSGTALAVSANCTVQVRPLATENGSYSSTLRISATAGGTVDRTLSGTASGF